MAMLLVRPLGLRIASYCKVIIDACIQRSMLGGRVKQRLAGFCAFALAET